MNQRRHDGECILIRRMREILTENGHQEVCLAGEVTRGNGRLSLSFPVGVYGFSAELIEPEELFVEARAKGLSRLGDINEFMPICGTQQYPLYWGIDKYIGSRLYAHLAGRDKYKTTGLIRLKIYESLCGKKIYCAVVIVKDTDTAEVIEGLLKERFPDLLKTTKIKT